MATAVMAYSCTRQGPAKLLHLGLGRRAELSLSALPRSYYQTSSLSSSSSSSSDASSARLDILVDPRAGSMRRPKGARQANQKNAPTARSARPSHRFVDRMRVQAVGGRGGAGSLSSYKIGPHFRPDGGPGGNGGSVIVVADAREQTLRRASHHERAGDGHAGGAQNQVGRTGRNRLLRVPCGVVVKQVLLLPPREENNTTKYHIEHHQLSEHTKTLSNDTNDMSNDDEIETDYSAEVEMLLQGKEIDVFPEGTETDTDTDYEVHQPPDLANDTSRRNSNTTVVLADLDTPGSHLVVARGGCGGKGSNRFARVNGFIPNKANVWIQNAQPQDGQVVHLELELKLIADIGLVGFPNAGKSSLLSALSRATPEIAPYPFTTLHPLLGMVEYRDGVRVRMADIPGLVPGAALGKGLGHDFLRHIERTRALLFLVDAAGVDGRDPVHDLQVLAHELTTYQDGSLLQRPALIVANKLDLLSRPSSTPGSSVGHVTERARDDVQLLLANLEKTADSLGIARYYPAHVISAGVTGAGLEKLSIDIRDIVLNSAMETETLSLDDPGEQVYSTNSVL